MNGKNQFLLICIISLLINVLFLSCKKSQLKNEQLPNPQIKAGIARIHGKLNDPGSQLSTLILRFQNPVTASEGIIEKPVEKDGSFYFEAPIECSTVFSSIYSPGFGGVLIELTSDEDIKVELNLDNSGKLKVNSVTGKSFLTKQDVENYGVVSERYDTYNKINVELICKMTPEEYANYEMDMMQERTDYAMKDVKFSAAGRNFTLNELKLLHLKGALLPYKERVEKWCDLSLQEPDIKYYTFLKTFDLNNPQYLYSASGFYYTVMQILLSVKALNIPPVSETPVEDWLNKVKATLSGLVGFDNGQFYDLLVANSYAMQFNDDVIPLSDKQKDNIKEYFGDGEIAKILLSRNEEIIKSAEKKKAVIVNETPDVSKEQLMNAIISKYKNNAVLVDFWATWCSPCMDAMARIDEIKSRLKDKNIVFVYITNGSSPKETWNKKINNIPGEHYYVSADEWEYLMKSFGFEGIPSYIIFNQKGKMCNKFTGFPGIEKMRTMIEELLQ